ESLAVLPLVNSLVYFVGTSGNAMQEVTIVLAGGGPDDRRVLRRFSWILGGSLSVMLALVVFTPLGDLWFRRIQGLPLHLVPLAFAAAQLAIVTPMLRTWEVFQRALLIQARRTAVVTWVAIAELALIAAMLYTLTQELGFVGVCAAPLSIVVAAASAIALFLAISPSLVEGGSKTPRSVAAEVKL
ncbi:MAG: hypothetical protein EBZ48_15475, partial [Proteobacteria bacterium]|nr:hypothetical protein [Pseudomonadota bacterium]